MVRLLGQRLHNSDAESPMCFRRILSLHTLSLQCIPSVVCLLCFLYWAERLCSSGNDHYTCRFVSPVWWLLLPCHVMRQIRWECDFTRDAQMSGVTAAEAYFVNHRQLKFGFWQSVWLMKFFSKTASKSVVSSFSESVRSTVWNNLFLKANVPCYVEQFDIFVLTKNLSCRAHEKFFLSNLNNFLLQTRKL